MTIWQFVRGENAKSAASPKASGAINTQTGGGVMFVALVVEGTVIDAKAVAIAENEEDARIQAVTEAAALNSALEGEEEGWGVIVVALPE